jgi:hypothetical protein
MALHTLVIGTSKSKNQNGYYIEAKEKFWGLLFKGGATPRLYEPSEFRLLIEQHGIGFGELAFDHSHFGDSELTTFSNDQQLKNEVQVLAAGIPLLMNNLNKLKPKRIVFNGKTAASLFLQYIDKKELLEVNAKHINQKGLSYGNIGEWNGIEMWMMPNMSGAAGKSWKDEQGELKWLSFWEMIAPECRAKKTAWIWISLFILIIITTIIYLKK